MLRRFTAAIAMGPRTRAEQGRAAALRREVLHDGADDRDNCRQVGNVGTVLARLRLRDRFTFAQVQTKKTSDAADTPKVCLYKRLAGADSAKDLFDVLKPLTRKGDDTPSRKSALFEEYNKMHEYLQSILDSTFNAKSILHKPYGFIVEAKERLGLTFCADVAFRAVTAISLSRASGRLRGAARLLARSTSAVPG